MRSLLQRLGTRRVAVSRRGAVDSPIVTIAPLAELPPPVFEPGVTLAAQLDGLAETAAFQDTVEAFTDAPERSLLNPVSRAALYQIIRLRKPEIGLEIGTLFAGSTEVMARALDANGSGRLITIDPVGGHRVPGIVAQWPDVLARRVGFHAVNSMQAFMDLDAAEARLGLSFIDGNHSFEFVYFDLLASARFMEPDGVIVLDNVEQAGPFFAVKRFLEKSRGWHLVGVPQRALRGAQRIEDTGRSIAGSAFFVLVAPAEVSIGPLPHLVRRPKARESLIAGFRLRPSGEAPVGKLVYKIIFVSRPFDYHLTGEGVERMVVGGAIDVRGEEAAIEALFDPVRGFKSDQARRNRVLECTFSFVSSDGEERPLRLVSEPEILLGEGAPAPL